MTRLILASTAILLVLVSASATTQTMRLDYYHTGDASSEVFSVDRIVIEPLPWPGDLKQAIGKDVTIKPDVQLHHEQFDVMAV